MIDPLSWREPHRFHCHECGHDFVTRDYEFNGFSDETAMGTPYYEDDYDTTCPNCGNSVHESDCGSYDWGDDDGE